MYSPSHSYYDTQAKKEYQLPKCLIIREEKCFHKFSHVALARTGLMLMFSMEGVGELTEDSSSMEVGPLST
jgi:hypothetical protein